MDFEFFYDLAEWVNEQWKCSYTTKEVAVNADIYKREWDNKGKQSSVIKELMNRLEEDIVSGDNVYAAYWISKLENE